MLDEVFCLGEADAEGVTHVADRLDLPTAAEQKAHVGLRVSRQCVQKIGRGFRRRGRSLDVPALTRGARRRRRAAENEACDEEQKSMSMGSSV